jgi:hypothetical protein
MTLQPALLMVLLAGALGAREGVVWTHLSTTTGDLPPPAPLTGCGPDPTADALGCEAFPPCDL